jgi:diadenosine tetraphosphatase ApaH/serine/threonine PP2A family protein phosphatase
VRRTIIIGDIHGCRDELEDLLDAAGHVKGDRVISVGDMVVRGPDPAGTVALLRSIGALAVRGNHEDRVLRACEGITLHPAVNDMTRIAAYALSEEQLAWIRSLPLWLNLPENGVLVVHAGVLPDVPVHRTAPEVLMTIRSIGRSGRPASRRSGKPWGRWYTGPPHVVFGHNALPEPQIHPWATGLDTGCVYGGRLTAMVLSGPAGVPPCSSREDVLVSVPARRAYVGVQE